MGLAAARRRQPRRPPRSPSCSPPRPPTRRRTSSGPSSASGRPCAGCSSSGVTISATGRRETGLERAEYDQGQHDDVRRVLAVNTAGMLVRLDVLRALGGFDAALPVFGNDLDFGWRAASAGYRTIIVPQAVVFHAEAAHRGHPAHAAHRSAHALPGAPRGAVHAAGQQPGPVAAVPRGAAGRWAPSSASSATCWCARSARPSTSSRRCSRSTPDRGSSSRPGRPAGRSPPPTPPPSAACSPRGGSPTGTGSTSSATSPPPPPTRPRTWPSVGGPRRSSRRRPRRRPRRRTRRPGRRLPSGTPSRPTTTRTSSSPTRACSPASSPVRSPSASRPSWSRSWSAPARRGGPCPAAPWRRLPRQPATGGSSTSRTGTRWRSARTRPHRPSCSRSRPWPRSWVAARPPRSAPCSCSPSPSRLWGAWRLVRVVGRFLTPAGMPRWLVAGAAATYALVPGVSGAWGGGRLGLVAAATLLPWLAHAALGFGEPERERRWRAAWRTGLLLALTTACAPAVFPFFVLLTLLVLGLGVAFSRSLVADRSVSGPPLVALAVVPLLLLPWWLPLLLAGSARRPAPGPRSAPGRGGRLRRPAARPGGRRRGPGVADLAGDRSGRAGPAAAHLAGRRARRAGAPRWSRR